MPARGERTPMPALLNKYFSFEPFSAFKEKANRRKDLKGLKKAYNNSMKPPPSSGKLSFSVTDSDTHSQISPYPIKDFPNKRTKATPQRYKRQTKGGSKLSPTPKGFQQYRVECWAKNEIGASSQPCIFFVSKVGEYHESDNMYYCIPQQTFDN